MKHVPNADKTKNEIPLNLSVAKTQTKGKYIAFGYIGGSKGSLSTDPLRQISFIFMQFSANNCPNNGLASAPLEWDRFLRTNKLIMHFCFAGSWESWIWQLRLRSHSFHEKRNVSGSQRQHQRVARTWNGTAAGAIYCPGCRRWKSRGDRVHDKKYSSALIYRYVDRTENIMSLVSFISIG